MTIDFIFINEILLNILNILIMMLPLNYFMTFRNKWGYFFSVLNVVVIATVFQFSRYVFNLSIVAECIIYMTIFSLYAILCYKDRFLKKYLLTTAIFICFGIANAMAYVWVQVTLGIPINLVHERDMYWLCILTFVSVLQFVLNRIFTVMIRWLYEKKSLKELAGYMVVPIYQFVLLAVYYRSVDVIELDIIVFGWASFFMALVLEYVLVSLAGAMRDKAEVEEQLNHLYRQRQDEMNYYQMTQQTILEMRKIRHEFVNQIQTAYLLIEQGSTIEEAKELLQKSHQQVKSISFSQYCDNSVINAIISVKAAKAKENNIEFSAMCQMVALDSVEEIDLCSLFGNLLDNAIEACTKMKEGQPRSVAMKAYSKGGYQVVRVENTYEPSQLNKDFLKTSKSDGKNHGFGMKVIDKISKKYGGEVRTEITDEKVNITVFLSLEQIKGNKK